MGYGPSTRNPLPFVWACDRQDIDSRQTLEMLAPFKLVRAFFPGILSNICCRDFVFLRWKSTMTPVALHIHDAMACVGTYFSLMMVWQYMQLSPFRWRRPWRCLFPLLRCVCVACNAVITVDRYNDQLNSRKAYDDHNKMTWSELNWMCWFSGD